MDPTAQSQLAALRREFKHEIATVRHEIRLIEANRRFETQWRRVLRAYVAALLMNVLAMAGMLYWFAKLLGH
jgi:hypothetical protein